MVLTMQCLISNSNDSNHEGSINRNEEELHSTVEQADESVPGSADTGSRANTRNVTVAIQYSWLNEMRNLGEVLGGAGAEADITATRQGQGEGENGDTFVLSFTDVPDSTSNDRFQEVIGIAAQFALSRVARRFNLLRGLSKESFETLPLKKLNELDSDLCSICYDDFEEEESNILKRNNRDAEITSPDAKRQRRVDRSLPVAPEATEETGGRLTSTQDNVNSSSSHRPVAESEQTVYKHSPTELPCGHVFGRDCIFKWTQEHNSCPICRARIVENEGLNRSVQESPVVMDEFDRQSFERIRQLIYGENATAIGGGAGDGGITLQRHNVIVIRPDSSGLSPTADRPNDTDSNNLTDTFAPNSGTPGNEPLERSNNEDRNTTLPQPQLPNGVEALGVIPLALFSLAPSGIRTTGDAASASLNRSAAANATGTSQATGTSANTANVHTSANNGASTNTNTSNTINSTGPLPMNSEDINRLFDLIANLTGRIQPNRTNINPLADTSLTSQDANRSSGSGTSITGERFLQPAAGRFGLFDILGRRRRFRNQNNTAEESEPSTETQQTPPEGNRNLFSTGVASFRDGTGVRTVDFTGEIPQQTPSASTSSESNANDNESSRAGN
ncbi:HBR082Cp [Eremothecium sinecaudum]|uniref:HBR082Cp n=1 Tax=Eremothecium sinecaudum TaxID=45286 RepID=A0A109UWX3_9SACH|nr:HBR082Cp [Eremothecium sinecaudum]AMD18983.1 HBR082Cp [Eremothecium sinecaudum]